MTGTIVDAGPLLAFLDPGDADHRLVADELRVLPAPLITVESVLSELAFLLRRNRRAMAAAAELVDGGVIDVVPMFPDHAARIAELMQRHASVPMALADAGLVRLSELFSDAPLLTFDTDFDVYRRFTREPLPLHRLPRRVQEPAVDCVADEATTHSQHIQDLP